MLTAALNALPTATGPLLWILTAVLGTFVLFVGITLAVALFHPDEKRREHARKILLDLLDFLRPSQRGGRPGRSRR